MPAPELEVRSHASTPIIAMSGGPVYVAGAGGGTGGGVKTGGGAGTSLTTGGVGGVGGAIRIGLKNAERPLKREMSTATCMLYVSTKAEVFESLLSRDEDEKKGEAIVEIVYTLKIRMTATDATLQPSGPRRDCKFISGDPFDLKERQPTLRQINPLLSFDHPV